MRFRGLVGELRGLLAGIGRETIEQILQAKDEARPSIEVYHASENLKKAAIAIFGDNDQATRWHEKLRDKLLLDDRAVETCAPSSNQDAGSPCGRRSRRRYDLPECKLTTLNPPDSSQT